MRIVIESKLKKLFTESSAPGFKIPGLPLCVLTGEGEQRYIHRRDRIYSNVRFIWGCAALINCGRNQLPAVPRTLGY